MQFKKDYENIITKEYLENHLNLTNVELAEVFGVSKSMILYFIRKYGLQRDIKQRTENLKRKNREKYGVDYPFNLSSVQEKGKITREVKYGYAYTFNDKEKIKQAIILKYGVENPQQNKDIHIKALNTQKHRYGDILFKSDYFKNKSSNTKLKRYGDKNYNNPAKNKLTVSKQSDDKKKLIHIKKCISSKNSRYKAYQTMLRNNTYGKSLPENTIYELLVDRFGFEDVIRQYTDDRYPFRCDFYIKSQDKFIECNFHWTHGGKPYDQNDLECQEKLKLWEEKAKTSKFYANAIQTWTIRDVNKLKLAKENNLNYKVFYNKKFFKVGEISL